MKEHTDAVWQQLGVGMCFRERETRTGKERKGKGKERASEGGKGRDCFAYCFAA